MDRPAIFHVAITRDELVAQTADLVHDGAATVDRLLSSAGQKDTGVAFCLATGGMVRMPYVREQLQQRFGLSRVRIAEHGDRIIAQGAAWIAHDHHRLCLAKPFEILDADDTYIPIIHAGQALPVEGQTTQVPIHFYCVDPRDGIAKLQFARPKQPSRVQPAHPRQVYTTLTLRVDPGAEPLVERLAVNLTIDENLVVNISAESTVRRDRVDAAIHDLEFGLRLDSPGKPGRVEDTEEGQAADTPRGRRGARTVANPTAVALRSNVVRHDTRTDLVPGEMITWNTQSVITDRQRQEHEYYLPSAFVVVCSTRFNGTVHRSLSGVRGSRRRTCQPYASDPGDRDSWSVSCSKAVRALGARSAREFDSPALGSAACEGLVVLWRTSAIQWNPAQNRGANEGIMDSILTIRFLL